MPLNGYHSGVGGERADFSDQKVVEFKPTVLICLGQHTGSRTRKGGPAPTLGPEPSKDPILLTCDSERTIADVTRTPASSQCKPDGEDERNAGQK